jgi:hypothetical protein
MRTALVVNAQASKGLRRRYSTPATLHDDILCLIGVQRLKHCDVDVVGAAGFEPATSTV